jgi:sRNA-binding carbon storage regulator CsrA
MAGLVLNRRKGQSVMLQVPGGLTMRVTVTELHRSNVKLLFDAPGVVVARAELYDSVPEPGVVVARVELYDSVPEPGSDGSKGQDDAAEEETRG